MKAAYPCLVLILLAACASKPQEPANESSYIPDAICPPEKVAACSKPLAQCTADCSQQWTDETQRQACTSGDDKDSCEGKYLECLIEQGCPSQRQVRD